MREPIDYFDPVRLALRPKPTHGPNNPHWKMHLELAREERLVRSRPKNWVQATHWHWFPVIQTSDPTITPHHGRANEMPQEMRV